MKPWILGLAVAATLPLTMPATHAAPQKMAKKAMAKKAMAKKMIVVRVCPISGDPVEGDGAGSRVVKNYKAYFC